MGSTVSASAPLLILARAAGSLPYLVVGAPTSLISNTISAWCRNQDQTMG